MDRVHVQIEWPTGVELPPSARAVVTVEDTSRSDASAVVLAETVLEDLDLSTTALAEVEVPSVNAGSDLTVRVHVSPSGRRSRGVEVGDLVSTQSHPVLTQGHGDSVVVPLRRVGP